jgi:hypothetical protein
MDEEWASHFCSFTVHKRLSTAQSRSAILFNYSSQMAVYCAQSVSHFFSITFHKWLSTAHSRSAILYNYRSQRAVYCAEWVSHFVHLQFTNDSLLRRVGQPFCSLTVHKWLSTAQSGSTILFTYSSKRSVCCAEWVSHFVHLQYTNGCLLRRVGQPFCLLTVQNYLFTAQNGSAILFTYSSKLFTAQNGSAILFTNSTQMAVYSSQCVTGRDRTGSAE